MGDAVICFRDVLLACVLWVAQLDVGRRDAGFIRAAGLGLCLQIF